MEAIALNEVEDVQWINQTGMMLWKNSRDDISRFLLNCFMKILLVRPCLCKDIQVVEPTEKGECTQLNLVWTLQGSNGFGSLLLNLKARLNCGITPV